MIDIKNLSVSMNDKSLLCDINMHIARGARHLLRGHNGSGKSTLASVIAGGDDYTITNGEIIFDGHNITNENATTRALMGIFLGAQNVPEIPGLTLLSFLKHSAAAHYRFKTGHDLSMANFLETLDAAREKLNIPREWLNRSVNVGFSGGERKRIMLLRLVMTKPLFAILDEPDSGADAETQKLIANIVNEMNETTFLIISHQDGFTKMIKTTGVTTLKSGRVENALCA